MAVSAFLLLRKNSRSLFERQLADPRRIPRRRARGTAASAHASARGWTFGPGQTASNAPASTAADRSSASRPAEANRPPTGPGSKAPRGEARATARTCLHACSSGGARAPAASAPGAATLWVRGLGSGPSPRREACGVPQHDAPSDVSPTDSPRGTPLASPRTRIAHGPSCVGCGHLGKKKKKKLHFISAVLAVAFP